MTLFLVFLPGLIPVWNGSSQLRLLVCLELSKDFSLRRNRKTPGVSTHEWRREEQREGNREKNKKTEERESWERKQTKKEAQKRTEIKENKKGDQSLLLSYAWGADESFFFRSRRRRSTLNKRKRVVRRQEELMVYSVKQNPNSFTLFHSFFPDILTVSLSPSLSLFV